MHFVQKCEFRKYTPPYLHLDTSTAAKRVTVVNKKKIAKSVGPDETAPYEPSHLDLHYLQKYLLWSLGLKGLRAVQIESKVGGGGS